MHIGGPGFYLSRLPTDLGAWGGVGLEADWRGNGLVWGLLCQNKRTRASLHECLETDTGSSCLEKGVSEIQGTTAKVKVIQSAGHTTKLWPSRTKTGNSLRTLRCRDKRARTNLETSDYCPGVK